MEYWSVYTFHPNITVLTALFRSGSPSGGTVFICKNMSYLWQKCTGVPCRVVWYIVWSCPAVSCTGKWVQAFWSGRLSAASMYLRECSVFFYTDVWVAIIEQCMDEDWHWTMEEVTMHRGIFGSAVFRVLWQDLKMRTFAAKWMPLTGNKAQRWSCCETCHNSLEWFCREGDRLNWVIAVSEMWVRAFEWELKSKTLSVIIHIYYKNASFGKINHRQSCWSFYVLFCVIPFHRVTLLRQYYNSFLQYHLRCVSGKRYLGLVENAIM